MKVAAVQCQECKDIIFSRCRHDFRRCSCNNVFVDGGFDYMRTGFQTSQPVTVDIEVNASKYDLYEDWNMCKDAFGLIRGEVE